VRELGVRLGHLIDMRGIGLVTGDNGSGKNTACRKVISAMHAGLHRVVYVAHSTGNVMDVYKTAWEMGLPTERNRAAVYRQIRTEVSRLTTEAASGNGGLPGATWSPGRRRALAA
jgi:general secretion pathway protein A